MLFAKTLVALAFAATALASSIKRAEGGNSTCFFIMTPDTEPSNVQNSVDFAIQLTVGDEFPNEGVTSDNSFFRHDNGTFDVTSVIAVNGEEPATVGAFVESLAGQSIQGSGNLWIVNAANC